MKRKGKEKRKRNWGLSEAGNKERKKLHKAETNEVFPNH